MSNYPTCLDCGRALEAGGYCQSCALYGTPAERRRAAANARRQEFDERLKSTRPALPCCGEGGECTGGASCWHDEPDNIPEDWA